MSIGCQTESVEDSQLEALPYAHSQHTQTISVGCQTESVEDPQLEELLHTRSQQARAIRALQGVLWKKNHDLQAMRNGRSTASAVGNIYLCPGGTVWHACEVCARQRANAGLVMCRPCARCGNERVPMLQILQEILYSPMPLPSAVN